jgi:hypothetical protein
MIPEHITSINFGTAVIGKDPREALIEVPLTIPAQILATLQMKIAGAHPVVIMPEFTHIAGLLAESNTATEGACNLSCVLNIHDHGIATMDTLYPVAAQSQYNTVAGHLILLS